MDDETFQLVRGCFEHDDGSLPGVELNELLPHQVAAIYKYIRQRSSVSTIDPNFWDKIAKRSVPLDAVPNAAELVAAGNAEPFHFCFRGLGVCDTALPELGLFVWPTGVELDYRMGPQWDRLAVGAFFDLLNALVSLAPAAILAIPSVEPPPDAECLLQAWALCRITAR